VREGWVVTTQGEILKTTDGGEHWSLHAYTQTSLLAVHFPPTGDIGYTCGDAGKIWGITPQGVQDISPSGLSGTSLNAILFPVSADEGRLCGDNTIRRFLNNTWNNLQIVEAGGWWTDIWFVDNAHGWAVGDAGLIRHTTDGIGCGQQRNPLPELPPKQTGQSTMTGVEFVDEKEGWIVGALGEIAHTTAGGGTWMQQASGPAHQLNALSVADAHTAYAVGSESTLIKHARLTPRRHIALHARQRLRPLRSTARPASVEAGRDQRGTRDQP
jgi:hypothetical protein